MNSKNDTKNMSDEDYWYNSWMESLNEDEGDKPSISSLLAKPRKSVSQPEAQSEAQQPEEELRAIRDAIHAENVRKFGEIDAIRMRDYGLSERDL